jgi:hypothetical protein
MGGGPSGFPMEPDFIARSTVGLFAAIALLFAPCRRPPSIHFRITAMSLSPSFAFGGIDGSSLCVIDLKS